MRKVIGAKTLRNNLREILQRVRHGERFTVLYRSRPVCQIVPLESAEVEPGPLEDDPLYRAPALGRSRDGKSSSDHDEILYGRS